MTDQWVPGPPKPPPWWTLDPLPPSDDWNNTEGCTSTAGPAIVQGITITGVPATVSSLYWQVSLNDGEAPPNFQINQLDGAGGFVSTSMQIAPDSITFNSPVMLSRDPVEPMEPVTLEYLSSHPTGIPDAPDNQTYGRTSGAWNLVVPAAGGTFTGVTTLGAGGAVTSGALQFFGSALLNLPTIAQLKIGDGPSGQVPTADGSGNLTWTTPVTGGPYLPIAGGTVTGSLTVNQVLTVQGANSMVLNAPNGQQRAILGQTSTLTRWQLMLGDGTSEGLNNTGSNFSLTAYATAGGFLGNWLTVARADGATVFNGSGVTIQGGLAVNGLLALAGPGNLAIYGGSAGQFLSTNGSGVLSWATPAGGGGGITDAPNDGTLYGRKSAAWSHLTHNDITDWATAVPPAYVLPTASTTVLGGVRVDGTTITITGGVISGTPSSPPPVTIGDTAPSSPAVGALWWDSVGGQMYLRYQDPSTTQWVPTINAASLPPPASTTVLGSVKVDGTSIKAAGDGTISTVLVPMGDNRIINGDMRIDQRNSGNSGTVSGYTIDRWRYDGAQTSKGTWQRVSSAAPGFPYCLGFTSSSAYAVLTGDYFTFSQSIEADMISDFAWGTSNAQPGMLSFWALSSLTGTFGGAVRNAAATRSYPFNFSLPVASTWTKITITIPGDIAGTWVLSGNAAALNLNFGLGVGSTYSGPANVWAGVNYLSATGAVSVVGTNGATFYVTGVKLEIGSVATPFNRQTMAKSMADCQRYYQQLGGVTSADIIVQGYAVGAGAGVSSPLGISAMRSAPTAARTGTWTMSNVTTFNLFPSPSTVGLQLQATAAGTVSAFTGVGTYLTLSAEL